MNCIIHIKTKKPVDDYSQRLSRFLGNNHDTKTIYGLTSLSNSQTFLPLYFYGNTNQTVNYLIAKENANTLRVFVEGVNRVDNLDQLVSSVKNLFSDIKSFYSDCGIKYRDVSATVWSEGEEMLRGEYQGYWRKFKSYAPDISTGIYLTVLTIFYSLFQPQIEKLDSDFTIEQSLSQAGINLVLVLLSILIWLNVKAVCNKTNLSFKLK